MPKFNLKQHILNARETPNHKARVQAVERDLINAESALGRTVFGAIQPGHAREFFFLKKNVWIWYENGITIRYEVRKNGVYKKTDNDEYYTKIEGEELANFKAATKAYLNLIKQSIYKNKK